MFEWDGSRANNICWMMRREERAVGLLDSPRVFVDPDAPEAERYRMVIYARVQAIRRQAFFALTSADGMQLDVA